MPRDSAPDGAAVAAERDLRRALACGKLQNPESEARRQFAMGFAAGRLGAVKCWQIMQEYRRKE